MTTLTASTPRPLRICVLGGTGFIGRSLVARLARDGHSITVPTRQRAAHRALTVLPNLRLLRADVHDENELRRLFAGQDLVVNLVGILNEPGLGPGTGAGFGRAHTELPIKTVAACRATGVRRYLHMSALRADSRNGPSHYLRSKGAAEDHLKSLPPGPPLEWTILQPSVVFGPDDAFVNKFAAILRITPGVLPLACADAQFAPVWVGDVAEAFARCAVRDDVAGRSFQLCGPEVVSLGDIVHSTAQTLGLRRWVLPLPRFVSRLQAALLDWVPGKPFSTDNFRSASVPSTCECDGLAELGIRRSSMRGIVPRYLRR
jgi:NADH dehydrogenase